MDNDVLYVDTSLELADEVGQAAAAMITQGGQGYATFLSARETFRTVLVDISSKYRIVVPKK